MSLIYFCATENKRLHKDWLPTLENFNESHKQIEKARQEKKKRESSHKWTSESKSKMRKWLPGSDGCEGLAGPGTEVDEKQRGRVQKDSGALCSYTRHWETHSNTFTHSHTDAAVHRSACLCPLPHRPHAGISEGSLISNPVLGFKAEPHSPSVDWRGFLGLPFTTQGISASLHKPRSSDTNLGTKWSRDKDLFKGTSPGQTRLCQTPAQRLKINLWNNIFPQLQTFFVGLEGGQL